MVCRAWIFYLKVYSHQTSGDYGKTQQDYLNKYFVYVFTVS